MSYRHDEEEIQDEDDIVLAPMNVEGMPWYRKDPFDNKGGSKKNHQYTSKESFYIILGTLKAALLIACAYLGGFALLILLIRLFS